MKIFLSADLEGISTTNSWGDCSPEGANYNSSKVQLTKEVSAACLGAFDAGAKHIVVKDAHKFGNNIIASELPDNVFLRSRWSDSPLCMVEGLDNSFDAAIFIGYHSAAGKSGNTLSHTISQKVSFIKINNIIASEFLIFSYASAYLGVPVLYLSGDKELCNDSKNMFPNLVVTPVKESDFGSTISYPVESVLKSIREDVKSALSINFKDKHIIELPTSFNVEIRYKNHYDSEKPAYYPGVERIDDYSINFKTNDYFEVLRMLNFTV